MPLEQQVVSLELAKELKELGYPQESLFYWHLSETKDRKDFENVYEYNWYVELAGYIDPTVDKKRSITAPTVAELGKLIGAGLNTRINMSGEIVVFHTLYESVFTAETEADARAKFLCYLLKNKIIELK